MKAKFLSALLALTMVLSLPPTAVLADDDEPDAQSNEETQAVGTVSLPESNTGDFTITGKNDVLDGTYVRDKDGIDAALLICEMASYWKMRGTTLGKALEKIQSELGVCYDFQDNFYCEGAEGAKRIAGIMKNLREQPPKAVCGKAVLEAKDFAPEANMTEYTLEGGCGFIVRPSGTEPKIKIYYSAEAGEYLAHFHAVMRRNLVRKAG